MNLNDTLHCISTMSQTDTASPSCQESGFHYSKLAPGDGDGPQWRTIQDIWFVTIGQSYNRRVTRPAENEHSLFPFAETLTLGGNP